MAFTKEEKDGNISMKVEGPMSIYEAKALHEELLACFEEGPGLELDLRGVTDCDMAGVQILWAAYKMAEKEKKRFSVSGVPQTFLDVLQRAGLNPDEILGVEVIA